MAVQIEMWFMPGWFPDLQAAFDRYQGRYRLWFIQSSFNFHSAPMRSYGFFKVYTGWHELAGFLKVNNNL